jgi:DNA-binding PadR family transcriptional regulator
MYIIILKALKNESLTGYSIICMVHREYGVLLGAGMVYNLLHSMEKRKLIHTSGNLKAKRYVLTKDGEEILEIVSANRDRIRNLTHTIF